MATAIADFLMLIPFSPAIESFPQDSETRNRAMRFARMGYAKQKGLNPPKQNAGDVGRSCFLPPWSVSRRSN